MNSNTPNGKRKITKADMKFIWKHHVKPAYPDMTYEKFEMICLKTLEDFDDKIIQGGNPLINATKHSKIINAVYEYNKGKEKIERDENNMIGNDDEFKEYFEELDRKIKGEVEETMKEDSAKPKNLQSILDEEPEYAVDLTDIEEEDLEEPSLERSGRNLYEPSIYTEVLTNYCYLSDNAKKAYYNIALNKYKNDQLTSGKKYEGIDENEFMDVISTFSDEELAKLNKAILETLDRQHTYTPNKGMDYYRWCWCSTL